MQAEGVCRHARAADDRNAARVDWRSIVAIVLLAGYALPLLDPPSALPPTPPAPDAGLLARVFPGVPEWWVSLRLLCLFVGAGLAAAAARPLELIGLMDPVPAGGVTRVSRTVLWAATALAGIQLVTASFVTRFTRVMQLAYVAALALPALVTLFGSRNAASPRRVPGAWRSTAACALIVALWIGVRLPVGLHNPRSADPVDTWMGWDYLEHAADGQFNILTTGFLPGVTALHLVLQGAGIWGFGGMPLRFDILQAVHVAGVGLSALALAALAARLLGPVAAVVATTVFLFSPYILMVPMQPTPYYIPSLLTASMFLLLHMVHQRRSMAALAALGPLAGIACTHPCTVPAGLLALAGAVASLWRRPRAAPVAFALVALLFAAPTLPGLPYQVNLEGMRAWYGKRDWQWTMLEATLLGQAAPAEAEIASHPGPLDVQLGAVLSPFAIPRTPMRMWGDSLFDPVGGGLAAFGTAVCLWSLRRRVPALGLLLLLLAGLAPAFFFSTYDRPSLARLPVLPVPVALLAAVGFQAVRDGLSIHGRSTLAAVAVSVAVAFGGIWLFDVVNPRILAASWLNLVLRTQRAESPATHLVILEPSSAQRTFEWLRTRPIAAQVPSPPIPVVTYEGAASLAQIGVTAPDLIFWSPLHEAYADVSHGICERWADAGLYTFTDAAGVSRVFAAHPAGPGWVPPSPRTAWRVARCGDFRG
jgi:hypothetical protein